MGGTCTILAHVRNSNGEVVESNLFKDLLHYTSNNRELAKQYYGVGTNETFLSKVREKEEYEEDENGEITFKSLKNLAKMDLETDKLIDTLNKDIHSGKYDYEDALRKVQNFNENNIFSDKVLATMIPVGNQYFVSVIPLTKNVTDRGKGKEEVVNSDEKSKLHDVVRNKELEKRILELLKRNKVSVKFIEGESEGGRYSTENIVNAENGLYGLIEIIEKGNTTETLAEEAGHFAVGALGDYPLVRRLENLLSDERVQREALGEEEYNHANLGNNPAREGAGKLVGDALQRDLGNGKVYYTLANRIANLAKRIFYNFTGNEVRWAAAKAEQIANKIAYQFVEGSNSFSVQNAINMQETMYNASYSLNVKTYRDLINELGSMCKTLDAIADDAFAAQNKASLAQTVISGSDSAGKNSMQYAAEHADMMADTLAFDGIVQALVQVTDFLGPGAQIDQMLASVNLQNPSEFYRNMAKNGRNLRQARTFLRSAEFIVNTATEALAKGLKLTNGVSLNDVRYCDVEGTWHTWDMAKNLNAYRSIIASKKSKLNALEASYFAAFCEDVYGKKYVSQTVGKLWHDIGEGNTSGVEEINTSIYDLVTGEGQHDIDLFHRYLGSMSNNPDIIGQIVDKLMKQSNKIADDLTLRYQEKLYILKDRAAKLELNIEDLFEKDDSGQYTGNLITPPAAPTVSQTSEEDFVCQAYLDDLQTNNIDEIYAVNHGAWERAREEHKKQHWEIFKKNHPDWKTMSGFTRGLLWSQYYGPEMKAWNKANSLKVKVREADGTVKYVKWVPNRIYKTDAWDKLLAKYKPKGNDSLRRWMHDYMEVKQQLDSMLPNGAATSHRAPQFRGTFMNSVRNQSPFETGHFKKAKSWFKNFGRRGILEQFVETADDTDYGDLTTMNHPDEELLGTRMDFEEERASRLPVFGVNKLTNMNDLSTDLFGSTLAYASMATSYACTSNIVDSLEVGKSALYNRKFTGQTKWSKALNGRKKNNNHEAEDEGGKNRAYGRYLKFLDKQVYGISAPPLGFTVGNKRFLVNKVTQTLSSLAGSMFLKGNVLGGAVNTATGFNNIFKEAITSEYFSVKDWRFAHKYYFSKDWVSMWTQDLGKLKKSNKLDLFLSQMNALSDNREKFRNWHTNRSQLNNFYRMTGYLPYSSGDHYMQAMSYLAVAHGTNLYNMDGTMSSNLWDAWKKKTNTDDNSEFSKGSTIEFNRLNPLNADEITTEAIDQQGVYLKDMPKTKENFHTWLYAQDSQFADEGYRSQNIHEYDDYRRTFNSLNSKDLVKFYSNRFTMLKGLLGKLEQHLASSSPLAAVPNYTTEEQQYINLSGLGTGEYKDLMKTVQEDLYRMIWTKSDESGYMDKCREINNRLHGIYNQQDKTSMHQNLYGNAFLAMKGWALGYIENMWSNNHYSIALGKNTEGFLNTASKAIVSMLQGKGHKRAGQNMNILDTLICCIAPWTKRSKRAMLQAGFTEEQHFNMRRFAATLLVLATLGMLRGITAPPDEDDDEEEPDVLTGLIHYLSYRTFLEQEAFLEATATYVESGSLMDAVPTGIAALMDLVNLAYQAMGAAVTDEDSSFYYHDDDTNDRYEEGDPKAEQHFIRLVPYWKSWWALQHPYEARDNYEFGRKMKTR